jgi:hypothetical protein
VTAEGALLALLEFSQVLAAGVSGGLINLVAFTVLGSLGAVLIYNAIARVTGVLRRFHQQKLADWAPRAWGLR